MSSTPVRTSSSSSSTTTTTTIRGGQQPVNYEKFAPRNPKDRTSLSRIQQLTCGPMFATTVNAQVSSSSTSSKSKFTSNATPNTPKTSLVVSAMIPPHGPPSSTTTTNNNNNNTHSPIDHSLTTAHQTTKHLTTILHHSQSFHQSLQTTLSLTHELTLRHSTLLQHSSELSLAAERLQTQSSQLTQHARDIGLPLKHYDAVDSLSLDVGVLFKNGRVVRGLANVRVDRGTEYYALVCRIEDAVRFFKERREDWAKRNETEEKRRGVRRSARERYESESTSGSVEYYKRSLVLREVALDLLREAIVQRIVQTTEQVVSALGLGRSVRRSIGHKGGGSGAVGSGGGVGGGNVMSMSSSGVVGGDVLEASLIYTRFHGISHRSQSLLNILKKCLERQRQLDLKEEQDDETRRIVLGKTRNEERNAASRAGRETEEECPYVALWNLCRNTYTQSRETLLKNSVKAHLDFLKEKHGLVGMARLASVFLIRVCTIETSLYLDFFGSAAPASDGPKPNPTNEEDKQVGGGSEESSTDNNSNKPSTTSATTSNTNNRKANAATLASQVMSPTGSYYDPQFQIYLDTLCTTHLHRTIRRGLVSLSDLDTLCQIVSVLREEMSLASASPTTMAASRALSKVIVDAQERLIYCANSVLAKEVLRFTASPDDLDYPDVLRRFRERREEEEKNGTTTVGGSSAVEDGGGVGVEKRGGSDDALGLERKQLRVYESWFPPIRSVLKVLSKIFRVVEPKVFEDIALTGVQACTRILKDGSVYVEKKSGVLHSDLFLVKHLLILREQLSPFDIQLRSIERQLDFSDAGKAVSKFLANRNRRLFSMSTQNALVTLLCEGVSTRESSIDSKRDLEDALRSACNDFIEHTVMSLIGPVLTFIEQCKSHVTAAKPAGSGGGGGAGGGGSLPSSLKKQSFMDVDYVRAVVNRTLDRLEVELGELTTQMGLYMDNNATAGILLKPVIRKISRFLEEAKRFVSEGTKAQDDGQNDDGDESGGWTEKTKTEIFNVLDQIETMVKTTTT